MSGNVRAARCDPIRAIRGGFRLVSSVLEIRGTVAWLGLVGCWAPVLWDVVWRAGLCLRLGVFFCFFRFFGHVCWCVLKGN